MKLTATIQISVDGVIQGNGGLHDYDRRRGFGRGGWGRGLFDAESVACLGELYQRASAFMFGRLTYDMWVPYWGKMELGSNPMADALNTHPKYVASNTLTNPEWAGTTVLSGDLVAAVTELKAKPTGELQVHGSARLIRWLFENDFVDEFNLIVAPVVVGQGTRLFPDMGPDLALELIESRSFPKGITLQSYRVTGRPEYLNL